MKITVHYQFSLTHMKSLKVLCSWTQICIALFSLCSSAALAQQPSASKVADASQPAQDSSAVIEYAKFLREEESSHREYLEKLYAKTTAALGVLATAGIALIGFLQYKTKKAVKEAVDSKFQKTVEEELQNRMKEFTARITERTQEVEKMVDAMYGRQAEPDKEASQAPVTISEEDEKILRSIGESQYAFRSRFGIVADAKQKDILPDRANQCIEGLTKKNLIGKTLGKKGGERWYVTEPGRRYLMSLRSETAAA